MELKLVIGNDIEVELPADRDVVALLRHTFSVLIDSPERGRFQREAADAIVPVLGEVLGYDLRAPTQAQINLATAIAQHLDIDVPPTALKYRSVMYTFLEPFCAALTDVERSLSSS